MAHISKETHDLYGSDVVTTDESDIIHEGDGKQIIAIRKSGTSLSEINENNGESVFNTNPEVFPNVDSITEEQ